MPVGEVTKVVSVETEFCGLRINEVILELPTSVKAYHIRAVLYLHPGGLLWFPFPMWRTQVAIFANTSFSDHRGFCAMS